MAAAISAKKVVQSYSLGGKRRETFYNNQQLKKKFSVTINQLRDTFWEKTSRCEYFWVHRVDVHGMPKTGIIEVWGEKINIPWI